MASAFWLKHGFDLYFINIIPNTLLPWKRKLVSNQELTSLMACLEENITIDCEYATRGINASLLLWFLWICIYKERLAECCRGQMCAGGNPSWGWRCIRRLHRAPPRSAPFHPGHGGFLWHVALLGLKEITTATLRRDRDKTALLGLPGKPGVTAGTRGHVQCSWT